VRSATVVATVAAVLAGYLLGSVPVAVLVARRHHLDPRRVGDRNPGYWNVKAHLGGRRALPVFVGDTLKGAAAAAVGVALAPEGAWGVGYAAVAAAMVGHAFPAFAGFRGGRSVLTFVGGMIVLSPLAAAVAGAVFVAVTVTVSFAWGARVAVFGFPVVQVVFDSPHRTAATGALMAIIGLRFATAGRSTRSPGTSGPATSAPGGAPRP
jgi:acyl phosphate:glycerol-3-phosphate acyltransferase